MKKKIFTALLLLCTLSVAAEAQETKKSFTVEVSNTWNKAKADEPVVIKLSEINPQFRVRSAVVMNGNEEIPSQLDDLNGDRRPDELAFLVDLPAKGKKTLTITLSSAKSDKTYPTRVYAEMLVSDKRGKHVPVQSVTIPGTSNIYNQMHHHGPAFESELVAYRLYFDHKQTVDIYGKFNKGFEIKESQFYPTDEQLARGFGDDVLMVGGSCGVGALKGWDGKKATHITPVATLTERIIAYGPVRTISEIEVADWLYQGSELNMTNRYTLYGGHRDVFVETFFEEPLKDEVFCTGVIDIKGSVSYSDHKGLIGCWGTDWPVNDTVKYAKETVGLATYIPQKYVKDEVKDKVNYLYTIGAKDNKYFTHNITFTSMKETFGYKTPEAWFAYIREWKEELEHPAVVKVINN
ncbi:DUF4861 domain-containing protein [Bacteroides sp. AM16-24]|uniref:DUF4861 domain-containing protein n=1 Tax=Bacteroides sp. AM16-24 TaxID=2292002 RepID=UPI000E466DC9|nr:DUF4861 domain-containing protein [Bacteroides sp. AM16-24]RHI08384.1 DUF4861 domain-containing protein [Bacteroides sp. AM16-24]